MIKVVFSIVLATCSWMRFQLTMNQILERFTNFLASAGWRVNLYFLKEKVCRVEITLDRNERSIFYALYKLKLPFYKLKLGKIQGINALPVHCLTGGGGL